MNEAEKRLVMVDVAYELCEISTRERNDRVQEIWSEHA